MDRRGFLTTSLAAALAVRCGSAAPGADVRHARNVVLVHGAYADGSSWSDVIPRLQAAGLNVSAIQNPLNSLAEDCTYLRRALALQDGPTVLVAHSYGGEVITETGGDPKVTALVYVAARAPDADEDYTALAKTYPTPPTNAGIVHAGGFARLSEAAFLNDFASGVERTRARILYAAQAPISDTLFEAKVTQAAWRTRPCFYAVSQQDRTIDPGLQRFMATRMKATMIELDAGHLSLVSHPHEVADLILRATLV